MRLVLKVTSTIVCESHYRKLFARAVASLRRDAHSVIVIYGEDWETGEDALRDRTAEGTWPLAENQPEAFQLKAHLLSHSLSQAGVPGICMIGSDADIYRVRKKRCCATTVNEPSTIDLRWLEALCSQGAVPVLSNLMVDEQYGCVRVDSNQLGALCAVTWEAAALIYLSDIDGVRD